MMPRNELQTHRHGSAGARAPGYHRVSKGLYLQVGPTRGAVLGGSPFMHQGREREMGWERRSDILAHARELISTLGDFASSIDPLSIAGASSRWLPVFWSSWRANT